MIHIKSIWENHKPPIGEIITKTRIEQIQHLYCYVATNHITGKHLYIMQVSKDVLIPECKKYHFKDVQMYVIPLEDKHKKELHILLLNNDLKDVFATFIQHVLEVIQHSVTESEAIYTTLNILAQWKILFEKIHFQGLTNEQQKGLIGELLFLNVLLDNEKTSAEAVQTWTSTERAFESKDFTIGTVGIEVKCSLSKYARIKISNESQLDTENFDHLFLVAYFVDAVKANGFSLNRIVEETREKIPFQEDRSVFDKKLQLNGYVEDDIEYYNDMYALKKTSVFTVTHDFPKIIKNNLPLGIYDTSYAIEIVAIESFIVEPQQIFLNIR